jgi:hypothetical protein
MEKRLDRMTIDEPIDSFAPCFNCKGAPFHSDDCDYRPRAALAPPDAGEIKR